MNSSVAAWWAAFLPLAWIVLTAIVNTIARFATPADVDAWAERQPRLAQFLSIMRRAGFEPIPVVQAIDDFFAGNPPPPGHAVAMGRPAPKREAVSVPAPRGFIEGRALAFLVLFACFGIACAAALAAVPAVTALGICVFDFVEANPGLTLIEYVARATLTCGGDALAILDELIASTSTNPTLTMLRNEAKLLKSEGGPKLQAFVGSVHARVGALRAERGGERGTP